MATADRTDTKIIKWKFLLGRGRAVIIQLCDHSVGTESDSSGGCEAAASPNKKRSSMPTAKLEANTCQPYTGETTPPLKETRRNYREASPEWSHDGGGQRWARRTR